MKEIERIESQERPPGFDAHMAELEALDAELDAMTDEQLLEVIRRGMRLVRDHLMRMGRAVLKIDARGLKVDANPNMLRLLRKVGNGEAVPEAVVRWASRPVTMAAVLARPVEEQRQLLEMDDTEVEGLFKKPRERRQPSLPTAPAASNEMTPKEVADLCVYMIRKAADPAGVVKLLRPQLDGIDG